jgi:SAM-dependent methyltransferase
MDASRIYVDGTYDLKTGRTWHVEDSGFKARMVIQMVQRHAEVDHATICDIGCGAGRVLSELERVLPNSTRLVGYEVSPQAHRLCSGLETDRCRFIQGDPFADGLMFDLAVVLDVVEHVEDCFAFLRQCATKATWKIYHIPLDTSASMILRGANCWDSVGHLHLFTIETALKSVEHSGQEVVDWYLTPVSLARPHRVATRFTNPLRRILPKMLGSRLFGGYSVMILAR